MIIYVAIKKSFVSIIDPMDNKKSLLKIFIIIQALTHSCTTALDDKHPQESGLWACTDQAALELCTDEFAKSIKHSSPELIEECFAHTTPGQDTTTDQERQLSANQNIKLLKTALGICSHAIGQESPDNPAKVATKGICQDLRMLSNNPNAGLQSIFQVLFGTKGLAPLQTDFGRMIAMAALTNPIQDLKLLEARATKIQRLVDNPDELKALEQAVANFSQAKKGSLDQILTLKEEPKPEGPSPWFWQKKYWSTKNKPEAPCLYDKDIQEFNDGLFDGTAKPTASYALSTIGSIPLMLILNWAQNEFLKNTDQARKTQGRIAGAYALVLINLLHIWANTLNQDKTFFKKLDGLVAINKSKIINLNLLAKPFTEEKKNMGYLEWQIKWAFNNFVRFLIVQNLIKAFPRATNGLITFISRLVSSPGPQQETFAWMKNNFAPQMTQDFIPAPNELFANRTKAGIAMGVLMILLYLKPLFQSAYELYKKRAAFKSSRVQLCNLKSMILQARECQRLLEGSDSEFLLLTNPSNGKNSFAQACWPMLNSKTSDNPASKSSLFNYGAVVAVHKFLQKGLTNLPGETPSKFEPDAPILALARLFKKAGEADLCVAMANLVLRTQDSGPQFSVAKFVEQKHAYINAQDAWHPLCQRTLAVPNSAELGTLESLQGQTTSCHGQIVTGGNSTGKSIYTSSITIAAYLAQCLGVAPVKDITMTPFDKFITQINTQDDPIQKKSLFRVQIRQVGEIAKEIIDGELNGLKIMVCLDESLSGTPPKYGRAILASVLKQVLKDRQNYIVILATHLKELAQEASGQTNGKILPMKMLCHTDTQGLFTKPKFQASPGVSDLDSALVVAEAEWKGLLPPDQVTTILNQARAAIAA